MVDTCDQIGGQPVLFVMAAEPEYGPHLRQRITPLMTGIGPVEAAVVLTATLTAMPQKPALIVSLGSAGSRRLVQAQVYQATHLAYRDMDASPLGFERGRTPLLNLSAQVPLPLRIPGIAEASLSTGASIVSGAAYDSIAEDMVDMETFAHLRAAMRFGIPLIGLRGISDGAEELRQWTDWTQFLDIIDENLASAVDLLAEAMTRGDLRL